MTNDCHVFLQQFQRDLLTSRSTRRLNSMSACTEEEKCLNRLELTQQSRSDAKYFCSDRTRLNGSLQADTFNQSRWPSAALLCFRAGSSRHSCPVLDAEDSGGMRSCQESCLENPTSAEENSSCSLLHWGKTNSRRRAALYTISLQLSRTQWVKSSSESSCLFKVNGRIIFSSLYRLRWPHLDFMPWKTCSHFHFRLQKYFLLLEAETDFMNII